MARANVSGELFDLSIPTLNNLFGYKHIPLYCSSDDGVDHKIVLRFTTTPHPPPLYSMYMHFCISVMY